LLTLTDEATTVWWQEESPRLEQWLRFHTGARSVAEPGEADFAVITRAEELPQLQRFAGGTAASPEHSCTLLIEVVSLRSGLTVFAHGPGIRESVAIAVANLPEGFWADWQANHAAFPQGVDIFFTCGSEVLGLPRTSRIGQLREV
jgi:alpha-D-ribose 1-methylphosphonate 5-triphosphate synthase subunit PhnH